MNLKDMRFDKRKHLKWIYRGGYHHSVFIGGYHQFLTGYQSNACIIALSTKVLNLQIKKNPSASLNFLAKYVRYQKEMVLVVLSLV